MFNHPIIRLTRTIVRIFNSTPSSRRFCEMAEQESHTVRRAPSTSHVRQVLEDELTGLLRRARDIKEQLNSLAPIFTLPSDLLSDILAQAIGFPDDSAESSWPGQQLYGWIRVTHVCTRWRAVAVGCPTLWNRIRVTRRYELMAMLVERSKKAPLIVSLRIDSAHGADQLPTDRATDLIVSQLQRVRVLHIDLVSTRERELFRSLFVRPLPVLEVLRIRSIYDRAELPLREYVAQRLCDTPPRRFRALELYAFLLNWHRGSFPHAGLTHLLLYLDRSTRIGELLNLFTYTPLLARLVLHRSINVDARDNLTKSPSSTLHHLRSMELVATPWECTTLLQHLYAPNLAYFSADVRGKSPRLEDPIPLIKFFETVVSGMRCLGQPQTLHVTANRPSLEIMLYETVIDSTTVACPTKDLGRHHPSCSVVFNVPVTDTRDPIAAFCQLFRIEHIRSLFITGSLGRFNEAWSHTLLRPMVRLEQLFLTVQGGSSEEHLVLDAMLLPHSSDEAFHAGALPQTPHYYPAPCLRRLTLDFEDFSTMNISAWSMPALNLVEHLQDCSIERYEAGVEIETMRIQGARGGWLRSEEIQQLRQVIRFVEWDVEEHCT